MLLLDSPLSEERRLSSERSTLFSFTVRRGSLWRPVSNRIQKVSLCASSQWIRALRLCTYSLLSILIAPVRQRTVFWSKQKIHGSTLAHTMSGLHIHFSFLVLIKTFESWVLMLSDDFKRFRKRYFFSSSLELLVHGSMERRRLECKAKTSKGSMIQTDSEVFSKNSVMIPRWRIKSLWKVREIF